MRAAKGFMAVAVLSIVALTGCSGKDDEKNVIPPSSLRVRVMSYDNKGQIRVFPGAIVVLGDSTGSMVASAATDANGEITFSNPPQNATVTSASNGSDFYFLHTVYDVNVSAVTIMVYEYLNRTKLATVGFNVTCNGASWVEMYASTHWYTGKICSSGTATFSVDIYNYDQQSDGKFSFLAVGLDNTGKQISSGFILDRELTDGMTADISLNPQAPFEQQVNYANIPANNGGSGWVNLNMRRTSGQTIYDSGVYTYGFPSQVSLSTSLMLGFTVPAPTDFATSFDLHGFLYLDTNNTGNTETVFGFRQRTTVPVNLDLDLGDFPEVPSGIGVENATTDRPTIFFDVSTLPVILVSGPSTTPSYSYTIEASSTRQSVVFPELPASLASFRPGAWAGKFSLDVENHVRGYCSSYSDCLTKNDVWAGTGTLTYLWKWTGRSFSVNGSSVTLRKSGTSSAVLPSRQFLLR